jgi:hypothetical protein
MSKVLVFIYFKNKIKIENWANFSKKKKKK